MKVEFSIFRKLYDSHSRINKRSHKVPDVVMDVFHAFFSDFTEKEVTVHFAHCNDVGTFDYESVTAALIHMISNTLEYVLSKSHVNIRFESEEQQVRICFEMRSLAIDSDEVGKLFDDGYSGKRARASGQASDGQGLYLVKRL